MILKLDADIVPNICKCLKNQDLTVKLRLQNLLLSLWLYYMPFAMQ